MKVLLISHTCFSSYNNMGKTFCSLFSEFQKEELCQLYIYPALPDVDICSSYYRITDKDVLKGLLRFRNFGGPLDMEALEYGKPAEYERAEDAAIYQRKSNTSPLVRLLRDAMWKVGRWYTPELRQWIDREKPTCIFLAPGYAKFIYDIALKIGADYELPIVTYICDDYYFLRTPDTLPGKMQLSLLQKKTDQIMSSTACLVTICREIEACYGEKFGVKTSVIMTGSERKRQARQWNQERPKVISYLGNIRCNRSKSLAEIGRALDRINDRKGASACLNIYTAEKDPQILKDFEGIRSVRMCGFVSGEAFNQVFAGSDYLVHAEAFDEESRDLVKHSVSTKIADSLASGIPLIAYGPDSIASMGHLIRNGCAFTATAPGDLEAMLEAALESEEDWNRISQKAVAVAEEYHDQAGNSTRLYEILQNVKG